MSGPTVNEALTLGPEAVREVRPGECLVETTAAALPDLADRIARELNGRLYSLFATDDREAAGHFTLHHLWLLRGLRTFLRLSAPISPATPSYPSISARHPAANWFEREVADFFPGSGSRDEHECHSRRGIDMIDSEKTFFFPGIDDGRADVSAIDLFSEREKGFQFLRGDIGADAFAERGEEPFDGEDVAEEGRIERFVAEGAEHGLLPFRATEVAFGVVMPFAHIFERGFPVEGMPAGFQLECFVGIILSRVASVADVPCIFYRDAADGIYDFLETVEIDDDRVVDRYPGNERDGFLNGCGIAGFAETVLVDGIDLGKGIGFRERSVEVPRNREEPRAVIDRVDGEERYRIREIFSGMSSPCATEEENIDAPVLLSSEDDFA